MEEWDDEDVHMDVDWVGGGYLSCASKMGTCKRAEKKKHLKWSAGA